MLSPAGSSRESHGVAPAGVAAAATAAAAVRCNARRPRPCAARTDGPSTSENGELLTWTDKRDDDAARGA